MQIHAEATALRQTETHRDTHDQPNREQQQQLKQTANTKQRYYVETCDRFIQVDALRHVCALGHAAAIFTTQCGLGEITE